MSKDERNIVEHMLRYKSIRATTVKFFGSLDRRWITRNILRRLLKKLIDKGIINIDQGVLEKLAAVSNFWKKYLREKTKTNTSYEYQQGTYHSYSSKVDLAEEKI